MFADTGATGQLGRLVITALLRRTGTGQIVALVRDPAKAADLAELGVTVRPFDYDAADRLEEPLAGVTRLLLVSSDTPDRRISQHRRGGRGRRRRSDRLYQHHPRRYEPHQPCGVAPRDRARDCRERRSLRDFAQRLVQ